MSKVSSQIATPETLISGVLAYLRNGRFVDASAHFAQVTHHGIGPEFKDKPRLAEFFAKVQEFYPDSSLTAHRILISGDHVILEWAYRATITEPFFGGASRKIQLSLKGASIIRLTKARSPLGPTSTMASPQGARHWPRTSRSGSNCEQQAQNWR
jgi:SnoaL-like domain